MILESRNLVYVYIYIFEAIVIVNQHHRFYMAHDPAFFFVHFSPLFTFGSSTLGLFYHEETNRVHSRSFALLYPVISTLNDDARAPSFRLRRADTDIIRDPTHVFTNTHFHVHTQSSSIRQSTKVIIVTFAGDRNIATQLFFRLFAEGLLDETKLKSPDPQATHS